MSYSVRFVTAQLSIPAHRFAEAIDVVRERLDGLSPSEDWTQANAQLADRSAWLSTEDLADVFIAGAAEFGWQFVRGTDDNENVVAVSLVGSNHDYSEENFLRALGPVVAREGWVELMDDDDVRYRVVFSGLHSYAAFPTILWPSVRDVVARYRREAQDPNPRVLRSDWTLRANQFVEVINALCLLAEEGDTSFDEEDFFEKRDARTHADQLSAILSYFGWYCSWEGDDIAGLWTTGDSKAEPAVTAALWEIAHLVEPKSWIEFDGGNGGSYRLLFDGESCRRIFPTWEGCK